MGKQTINQYDVFWISLDPTQGSEIAKTRPCVVISPDEINSYLRTVIVAPLTSTQRNYPYRVECVLNGKSGSIALDQIRTVDKSRLDDYIGTLRESEAQHIKEVLREMFCE